MWSYPLWQAFVKKGAAKSTVICVRKLDFGKYCNLRVLECLLGEMGFLRGIIYLFTRFTRSLAVTL